MKQETKNIQNTDFTFLIGTENKSSNHLTVIVSIKASQEAKFSKLQDNSSILKEIAIRTAKVINEKFELLLNPVDSGIEWQGHFKLKSA